MLSLNVARTAGVIMDTCTFLGKSGKQLVSGWRVNGLTGTHELGVCILAPLPLLYL